MRVEPENAKAQAQALARGNLAVLAKECLEWRKTGRVVEGGKLVEMGKLLEPIFGDESLRYAEGEVVEAALKEVAGR